MTTKQYKTLSDKQLDDLMKQFKQEHPAGRWDPHYFNYVAHNTRLADGYHQEVSQYQFTFLDGDQGFLLSVGTQNVPDYDNRTDVDFRQTCPANKRHSIFAYQDMPPLADAINEKDTVKQEALYLACAVLKEIDKKCVTK